MSEVDAKYVKRGIWINIEQGSILGRTLTTDTRTGTVIVAILSVLSALALAHLWSVFLFVCHQTRARGGPADGLFRQQQALLRATPPPSSLFADWLKLWWLWRGSTKRALSRTVMPLLLALLFACGTIAAGIFASYVVSSTDLEVLVHSTACAPFDIYDVSAENWQENIYGIGFYQMDTLRAAKEYAQDCYQDKTSNQSLPTRCGAFVQPNVPLPYERVDCPFDKKICIDGPLPAVQIDSGLVDAVTVFGWNFKRRDNIRYRKRTTCAPLRYDGEYSSVIDARDWHMARAPYPGEEILMTHYGYSELVRSGFKNATFPTSLMKSNLTYGYRTLQYHFSPALNDTSFIPRPELRSNDADLSLIGVVKNSMRYTGLVNDPVFAAHNKTSFTKPGGNRTVTVYQTDWVVTAIGCHEQHQFCHNLANNSEMCTDLTLPPASITPNAFPGASDTQLAALQLLLTAGMLSTIDTASNAGVKIADQIGAEAGYIPAVPDDQWVQEVVGWERRCWAWLQIFMSDYAAGYQVKHPDVESYMRKAMTQGEKTLCGTQKMRKAGGFVNINVFGLAFIVAFACGITLLDLVLVKFLIFTPKIKNILSPRIERWIQDGVFHWQRRAYEASNEGTWTRLNKEIPITSADMMFSEFPQATRRRTTSALDQQDSGDLGTELKHVGFGGTETPVISLRHADSSQFLIQEREEGVPSGKRGEDKNASSIRTRYFG